MACLLTPATVTGQSAVAQPITNPVTKPGDKFGQMDDLLPTPNDQRTASGAPGARYWQQRADYEIKVNLDDTNQRLSAAETITYYNNSPDSLSYLWLQLDQNIWAKDSENFSTQVAPNFEKLPFSTIDTLIARREFEGGEQITAVRDAKGAPLPFTVVRTMMRIDLPQPLPPGQSTVFSVDWHYNINDAKRMGGRTGYEYFPADKNYIYEIAQWFPRMAAYYDVYGWQHKQFLGSGEFTLEFGNYRVSINVPDDHIVAATGVLQNPQDVLTPTQRQRLEQAKTAKKPMYIVTPAEAKTNEAPRPTSKRTWIFVAENVRDFAFASSRKFIWDAQGHNVERNHVMAMSFYPKEGEPLWSRYSTQAIEQALDVYSRHTVPYPYPVAQSVNGPVGGMEYPMICFNGPRPLADGTYPASTKHGLISVIIHEVGHNYFPMIINSDERQWTWLDEGLNTFTQYLAEQEWQEDYPSRRGEPKFITEYMNSADQVPIMTNSEQLLQFGPNAYAKPATALNVLRESVLGRELFDFAFKQYARRWAFKRPTPADLFRTMEDASGVDLDWFWRGWFYTTDHVDISIERVRLFTLNTMNPDVEKALRAKERAEQPQTLSQQRNKGIPKRINQDPSLRDFYNTYDELVVTPQERDEYQKLLATLTPREQELLKAGTNFYVVDLKNIGGLVMPVILEIEYADGTKEELRIPAEIWRYNNAEASKLIATAKEIRSIALDPHLETADVDISNNYFPRRPVKIRFPIFSEPAVPPNPMQLDRRQHPERQTTP
ncbi:MAG: M1 family metallopeptidase [Pyrinomonadaceae bacterium]